MLMNLTEKIQSQHHKCYERAMMEEYKQHQNRLELIDRYIVCSKYIHIPFGTKVDYPLRERLLCYTLRQLISTDKDNILSFHASLNTYEFDLRTGVLTNKGRGVYFEGKRVVRGREYREDDTFITMVEKPMLLYRDTTGVVKNYPCETGFSFYHDGKVVPVTHTSPESRGISRVSVVIEEKRVMSDRVIQTPADIIDVYEEDMVVLSRKERCYLASGTIFLHNGVYYNYYTVGRRNKVKTFLRHLGSGTKIDTYQGYHYFFSIGRHLVKVTDSLISVFFNHEG